MSAWFAVLLALCSSLRACPSPAESLSPAPWTRPSDADTQYCTEEGEYCKEYPMAQSEQTTADTEMESQQKNDHMEIDDNGVIDGGATGGKSGGQDREESQMEVEEEGGEGGEGGGGKEGEEEQGEGGKEGEEGEGGGGKEGEEGEGGGGKEGEEGEGEGGKEGEGGGGKEGEEGGGKEGEEGGGKEGEEGEGEGGKEGGEGEGEGGKEGEEEQGEGGKEGEEGGKEGKEGEGEGGKKGEEKQGGGKEEELGEVKKKEEGGAEGGDKETEAHEGGDDVKKKKKKGKAKKRTTKTDSPTKSKKQRKSEAKEEEPLPEFPKSLAEFKYEFRDGKLRHTETGEPFVFVVREGDQRFNQAHYEALGEVISEHVYGLLETEGELRRTIVPVDAKEGEPQSFVFESEDARTNEERLMVLIHGSGVVRAGQWARRLIINDCLDSGTQLPFIKRARQEGYGVLVLNTNRNGDTEERPIRGNSSPEEHANYVWNNIIDKCAAKEIYIVAHSYGGVVASHLADQDEARDAFQRRVRKIAFTDSVHSFELQSTSPGARRWLVSHSRNWISCSEPLDQELMMTTRKVQKVSAGTTKHEETSYFAMDSIFKYFTDKK